MFLCVLALGATVVMSRDELRVLAHARDELCAPVTWWGTAIGPAAAHALKQTRRYLA
jgi:hypothetical protein